MTDNGIKTKGPFLGLERAEWSVWLKWMVASAIGLPVGLLAGVGMGSAVGIVVAAVAGWVVGVLVFLVVAAVAGVGVAVVVGWAVATTVSVLIELL